MSLERMIAGAINLFRRNLNKKTVGGQVHSLPSPRPQT